MNIIEIDPGISRLRVEKAAAKVRAWNTENADSLFDALFFLGFACDQAGVRMDRIITPHDIPSSRDAGPFRSNAKIWGVDRDGYAVYGDTAQHITHITELPI